QKQANDNVNNCNQNNHCFMSRPALAGFLLYFGDRNDPGFRRTSRWCGRGDLNPHAFRRHPLKMVCLPVSPLPHSRMQRALRLSKQKRRGKSSITKQKGRDEAVVEFSYCAGLTSTRKWLSARNLTSRCKA